VVTGGTAASTIISIALKRKRLQMKDGKA